MRVLSIDGGGIRGLIPALVLAELERRALRAHAEELIAARSGEIDAVLALLSARSAHAPTARTAPC